MTNRPGITYNKAALPCPDPSRDRLERILERYQPLLRRLCSAQLEGAEDVEDLEGAVILTVCDRFDTFDPTLGSFGTWLGAIVRREAVDFRRNAAQQPQCVPNTPATERFLSQFAGHNLPPCDDEFGGIDSQELPEILRQAFALVKLEGLTCAEAAQRMGRSEASVRTCVWKARQLLQAAVAT